MTTDQGRADQIAANLDRLAHEAADPFVSAKHEVRFILRFDDPDRDYPGRFVRAGVSGEIVAVTPETRQQLADRLREIGAHPHQIDRIMAAPVRADGLVLLDEWTAILITTDPKNAALVNEQRRRKRRAAEDAERLARVARQQIENAAILAALPTEFVDRYIVEQMGCAPERFAAFGKATRRDWRRRARQEMTAKGLTLH